MQTNDGFSENELEQFHQYAIRLMIKQEMSATYTIKELMKKGLNEAIAQQIVEDVKEKIRIEGKENGVVAMLTGGLACIAGLIGTFADTGHIFWGAIVFGGIAFFRGVDRFMGYRKHL